MLKINALRLEINTSGGLFGITIKFENGLNIVRGNNTIGKSTIFQSILYGLGFEELLGGKNEKTMQSVLKDEVLDDEQKKFKVLQSFVLLEIENREVVTIRRSVVSENRKSILMDVISGSYIFDREGNFDIKQMYVHDKGSASDENYGFHSFLEHFLDWDLPEAVTTSGDLAKLYLPLIAPAFIIEQKVGWSTFFASQPYYGIKNAEARVIEFILNLDVFQNERKKQIIQTEKRLIEEKWDFIYVELKRTADKSGSELVGLNPFPQIINTPGEIYLRTWRDGRSVLIPELIQELSLEFKTVEDELSEFSGIDVQKSQERLEALTSRLNRYSFATDQKVNEINHEREKLRQYIFQERNVEEDLRNNKSALKMYKLGADLPTNLADSTCPTCGNLIADSLLPKDADLLPMQIDENIKFSEAQKKMLDICIEGQRKKIIESETRASDYRTQINLLRQQIRAIKRDLISDDRLPSEERIEYKLNLKKQIEFYSAILEDVELQKAKFIKLSKDFEKVLATEKNLPKDFFSSLDREKLKTLEEQFLRLLKDFNYKSKDRDAIKISTEKYLPVIEYSLGEEKLKHYDIRFDSSGSDLIRCLWAYYVSLLKTSLIYNGCHPGLLIFDEPQQQSSSTDDFHDFLKELSSMVGAQIIIFASFQNSNEDFEKATSGINFNLIYGETHFIKREVN